MLSKAEMKIRSKGIGSSEIAMLVQVEDEHGDLKPLSPWGGPHKLWRRKTSQEPKKKAASYMDRGNYMETGLCNWYADAHGVDWKKPKTVSLESHPYVVDSADGLTYPKGHKGQGTPLRCIEAKTTNPYMISKWGTPGTDEVPDYYLVQCQWHLGAHETQHGICDVPLDTGIKREDYHVAFDEELWLSLVCIAEKFWVDHVKSRKEPPVDDYGDACNWLSKYLKNRAGMGLLEANEEQIKLMLRYRHLALQSKANEEEMQEMQHDLQRDIGEYDGIIIPGTKQKILWRKSKDTVGVVWQDVSLALARQLIEAKHIDQAGYEKTIAAHRQVTREGVRKWTPTSLLKHEA